MKGELALKHWQMLMNNKTGAATSDLIGAEIDVGNAGNGTIVVIKSDLSDANNDINNFEVWTSSSDHTGAMLVSNTQKTATTNTVKVALTSDADNLIGWSIPASTVPTARTGLSITSNTLAKLSAEGVYVINCPDLRRYVNIQYSGEGTKYKMSALFIAADLARAPRTAARTAYVDSDA